MAIQKVTLSPELQGFYAQPSGTGPFPVILLFTEGFGLNSDMLEDGAQKLADNGFACIAPDIFHGDVLDGADRDKMLAKIRSITDEQVIKETRETLDWLKSQPSADNSKIGGIGFCMGGRLAFLAHSQFAGEIKASVAFYGGGIAPDQDMLGRKPLLDHVPAMQGHLFLGYGADDAGITPQEHARIVEQLSSEKKRFEFHLFTGAGHAFLSPSRPNYCPDAAAEAWPIVFDFYRRSLG